MQLGIGASRIQEFQRKVQEEFSKPRDKKIPWLNKIRPPLDTWSDNLHVISVICDPGIIFVDFWVHIAKLDDRSKVDGL